MLELKLKLEVEVEVEVVVRVSCHTQCPNPTKPTHRLTHHIALDQ